jgi:phosphatidylserine/phosphatidylglycerophosphate/cardiolipin synthase-like enzyme
VAEKPAHQKSATPALVVALYHCACGRPPGVPVTDPWQPGTSLTLPRYQSGAVRPDDTVDMRARMKVRPQVNMIAQTDTTQFARPHGPIIDIESNAWQTAEADKVAFLIDGDNYFRRLDQALRTARHTVWIVGWDFNPNLRLRPADASKPETIGALLRAAVDANPDLEIRILVWGMGPIYSGKTFRFFRKMEWNDHPRITLKFDLKHPIRASHHQKFVCIDDAIAFLGGMDLTARRWDDREHKAVNALRASPDGKLYGPVHDVQSMVSGAAAKIVGDIARRRWAKATGETVEAGPIGNPPWPEDLWPALTHCPTAVALTEPRNPNGKGRRDAIRLTHAAIRAARKLVYIETQYLASFGVADTIAERLAEPEGPEIVVIVTRESHGFIEKLMMGNNRDRLIRRLKRADTYDRLRVMFPVVADGKGGEQEVIIHSKTVIVDDYFVRVGSSNLNYRSEGMDTESDLAFEITDLQQRAAVCAFRCDLMAEHLGASIEVVETMMVETGSMVATIDRLNTKARGLRHFAVDIAHGETTSVLGTGLFDPQKPFWPLQKLRAWVGTMATRMPGGIV